MYTIKTEVTLQDVVNIYFLNINELCKTEKISCYKTQCEKLPHFTFSLFLHNILTTTLQHAIEYERLIKYSCITKYTGSTFHKVFTSKKCFELFITLEINCLIVSY